MAGGQLARVHWADYLVTALSLLIALGIGIFFAVFKGGQKTKEEYLVGGRRMGLAPVSLSLFITFQSAITLLGVPADIYSTGTMLLYFYLGMCLAYVLGCFTVVPVMYPLRLTSVYQYLWLRFQSTGVKYLVTFIGMLQLNMYMAIALYGPALVLQAVVGLPMWVSLVVVGCLGTIYTAIGGIKSVLWTDVYQTVMMFIGILTILVKGIMSVGGFSQMWTIAADGGRIIFDDVDLKSRHSVWSTVIGGCSIWLMALFHQSTVQRISALPSQRLAKWCFLLNIPFCIMLGVSMCLMGVLIYAYFNTTGCDPYAAGYIHSQNQVAPYFVLQLFGDFPGMTGLYLSMLFCGSLSTFSSGINSLAANTVEDVLARPLKGLKDTKVTVIAKCIVMCYGLLSVGLAYLLKNVSGPVSQMAMSVDGSLGSPVLGVMFLGAAFPRSNRYGAGGGLVVGLAVSLFVGIGSTIHGRPSPTLPPASVDRCNVTNSSLGLSLSDSVLSQMPMDSSGGGMLNSSITGHDVHSSSDDGFALWDLSYFWYSLIGSSTTFVSGVIISLITGCMRDQQKAVDPKLIFPFVRKLYGLSEPESDKDEQGEMNFLSKDYREEKMPEDMNETSPFMIKGPQPASV